MTGVTVAPSLCNCQRVPPQAPINGGIVPLEECFTSPVIFVDFWLARLWQASAASRYCGSVGLAPRLLQRANAVTGKAKHHFKWTVIRLAGTLGFKPSADKDSVQNNHELLYRFLTRSFDAQDRL